jgi:hypothetical protein
MIKIACYKQNGHPRKDGRAAVPLFWWISSGDLIELTACYIVDDALLSDCSLD